MLKHYKNKTTGEGPFTEQDFGYTCMSPELIEQMDLEEVDASYQPTPSAAVVKQQKYSVINADYSQKIAAICTSGITAAKQDTLIADLRAKWKAAILAVSES